MSDAKTKDDIEKIRPIVDMIDRGEKPKVDKDAFAKPGAEKRMAELGMYMVLSSDKGKLNQGKADLAEFDKRTTGRFAMLAAIPVGLVAALLAILRIIPI